MTKTIMEQIELEREILSKLKETKKYVDEKFKNIEVDNIDALMSVLSLLADSHQHKLSELKLLYVDLITKPTEKKEN